MQPPLLQPGHKLPFWHPDHLACLSPPVGIKKKKTGLNLESANDGDFDMLRLLASILSPLTTCRGL